MKKMAFFILTLMLAFFVMDHAFASSESIMDTPVQTSKFGWGILEETVSQSDHGADQTCDPGLKNPRLIAEGKDVGSTGVSVKDANNDGVHDSLKIDVGNAYPSYYNKINIDIKNFGEIAVKKKKAVINWQGKTAEILEGLICYLHRNGELSQGTSTPDDAVLEIRWTGSGGDIQYPGEVMVGALEFHVLQAAEQNHSYCFDLILTAEAAEVADSIVSEEEGENGSGAEDVVAGIVDLPKTGGNAVCYYFAGAAMLLIGAVITVLRKK
ncbi:MAG: LPXTG cell wall anchor domain-containing protein [Syntrophomonadaceae bacterium]|jgi:hypothetical protein|nr:LPXTG cell wall anchor domain-containing protein [Thermoanaerobacterales bacterium]NLN21876.1 LPXTG cell wall anchor domain-containing protein [Syntrophomonadaceae bacterium]HAF17864.1 hypothetical protein [Peptococcaceae bacterium]